jgi:hypothetical protein
MLRMQAQDSPVFRVFRRAGQGDTATVRRLAHRAEPGPRW